MDYGVDPYQLVSDLDLYEPVQEIFVMPDITPRP